MATPQPPPLPPRSRPRTRTRTRTRTRPPPPPPPPPVEDDPSATHVVATREDATRKLTELLRRLPPKACLVLVTGPAGCGKTTACRRCTPAFVPWDLMESLTTASQVAVSTAAAKATSAGGQSDPPPPAGGQPDGRRPARPSAASEAKSGGLSGLADPTSLRHVTQRLDSFFRLSPAASADAVSAPLVPPPVLFADDADVALILMGQGGASSALSTIRAIRLRPGHRVVMASTAPDPFRTCGRVRTALCALVDAHLEIVVEKRPPDPPLLPQQQPAAWAVPTVAAAVAPAVQTAAECRTKVAGLEASFEVAMALLDAAATSWGSYDESLASTAVAFRKAIETRRKLAVAAAAAAAARRLKG